MNSYTDLLLKYESDSGKVYTAIHRHGLDKYVIKVIKADPTNSQPSQEVAILKGIAHPNIVTIKESFSFEEQGSPQIAMVMEYCSMRTIEQCIEDFQMTELKCYSIMNAISKGIKHLHDHHIVHRDLKPQNILLHRGKPKIADLGLATVIQQGTNQINTKRMGTRFYGSPEMDEESGYGFPTDVWSLGIIFLELFLGERIDHLVEGMKPPCRRKSFPSKEMTDKITNDTLKRLIRHMLTRDPRQRYTIDQVVQKLDKLERNTKENYMIDIVELKMSMIQEDIEQATARRQLNESTAFRLDLSRSKKLKTYKLIVEREDNKNSELTVCYDDYHEHLWLQCETFKAFYTYSYLPKCFQQYWEDMYDLVACMRKNTTGLSLMENAVLNVFFQIRVQPQNRFWNSQKRHSSQPMRRTQYTKYLNVILDKQRRDQEKRQKKRLKEKQTKKEYGAFYIEEEEDETPEISTIDFIHQPQRRLKPSVEPSNKLMQQIKAELGEPLPPNHSQKNVQKGQKHFQKKAEQKKNKMSSKPVNKKMVKSANNPGGEKILQASKKSQDKFTTLRPPETMPLQKQSMKEKGAEDQKETNNQKKEYISKAKVQVLKEWSILNEEPLNRKEQNSLNRVQMPPNRMREELLPGGGNHFKTNHQSQVQIPLRGTVSGREEVFRNQPNPQMLPNTAQGIDNQFLHSVRGVGPSLRDSPTGRRMPQKVEVAWRRGMQTGGGSGEDNSTEQLIKQIKILEMVSGPQKIMLPQHYTMLGRSFFKNHQRLSEAIQTFDYATQKYLDYNFYNSESCAINLYWKGKALLQRGSDVQALQCFEEAQHIFREINSKNTVDISKNLNEKGRTFMLLDKYPLAEECFLASVQKIRSCFGDLDCYQKKYKADPTANLGHLKLLEGNYEEALSKFREAIKVYEKFPSIKIISPLRGIASVYFCTNNFEEGVIHMEMMFEQGSTLIGRREVSIDLKRWVQMTLDSLPLVGNKLAVKMSTIIKKYAPEQLELHLALEDCKN